MDFTNLINCMEYLMSNYKVPGLDIIVNKNHQEIFRYTKGYSDIESGRKMEGNEIYDIYSMTKMITCVSAIQLMEKGMLSLDDKLSEFFPEFENMRISEYDFDVTEGERIASGRETGTSVKSGFDGYAKTPITIKHLFTMSAGLDYDLGILKERVKVSDKKSTKDVAILIAETVLGFEPGTRFRYSLCHDVLGAVIEIVSGKKLGDYMKENIFVPLGMNNTSFDMPVSDRVMVKYRNENGEIVKADHTNNFKITGQYQSGGAGLVSTAQDYALFLDAIACGGVGKNGNRILTESSVRLMGTNHLEGKALSDFDKLRKGYGYGLGARVHIDKAKSGKLSPVGEFGWDGAAGAFSLVDTKNKISIAYFQEMFGWDLKMQELITNALYSCIEQE